MNDQPALSRRLNLPLLTIFGLGTMVGAGIYVLVGEILSVSGNFAPWAFLFAALVAGFTATTYGELASHYPKSAGEAVYVDQAFARPLLTRLTGWAVVLTGLVSSGTLANGFAGYLSYFYPGVEGFAATGFILVLGVIAAWGIGQTVWIAAGITAASLFGLLAVVAMSGRYLANLPEVLPTMLPATGDAWLAITLGAFVAFYAFIGFEDMVNVAEETHEPERIMSPAILLALLSATVLYVLVASVAVLANAELNLAGHSAPLAAMVAHTGERWPAIIAVLSMLSVTNSALAQVVMVSRVVYGMANAGNAPAVLAVVHPTRHTPLLSTVLTVLVIVLLATWFPLLTLAKATSFVILVVFTLINLSLIRLKLRGRIRRRGLWKPVIGALLSVGLIVMSMI
ncbi:MAG: amino acid permease [Gammaproteobacteria bacterium]|jgi:amino acid transporter|nr:MAG: amino acid permease [Gammaproteobacteria bacterium]